MARSLSEERDMAQARILVVSGDQILAGKLQRMLVRAGHTIVAVADTGEAAVGEALRAQPDLALIGTQLAGALDAIAAAALIRAQQIPVLYLPTPGEAARLNRAAPDQPFSMLIQPFRERELQISVELALYRDRVERKLYGVERWLATTLTSIGDAVIATDLAGRITLMNPIAESITGWSRAEALGQPIERVFAARHSVTGVSLDSPIAGVLRDGITLNRAEQTSLMRRDGTEISISDSAAPIRDERGGLIGVVLVFRDITDRELADARLRHYALHDQLTGLYNRVEFMERLRQAIERSRRRIDRTIAILFLDLDRFKVVNESLGHLAGDQLLVGLARRIERCLRGGDTFARLGGDEFIVLLDQATSITDALQVAERIHALLRDPFDLNGQAVFTSASIGIAMYGPQYIAADDLLRDADLALYRAKAQGPGHSAVFDPILHAQAVERLQTEMALRYVIERDELRVYYQPIIELASGRLSGFEALVRWNHPQRGLTQPAEFMPLAEETGQIVPIGGYVLRTACAQLRQWHEQFPGLPHLTVSVNLSSKQVGHPELVGEVRQILAETGVDPAQVRLEVTESVMIEHTDVVLATLRQLRGLGVSLHLDDFGTGYSSLSTLHHFPITTVKIDRSFVQQLGQVAEPTAMVESILILAQKLGLEVVAEGIESAEQRDLLHSLSCHYAQGYLFAQPLEQAAATRLLESIQAAV
jgi:diguanylate cyclase (GGDEF)-like protein/PAS domain S-box-containing protein